MGCAYEQNNYSEYRNLPRGEWRYRDVLEFRPVHMDSLCAGCMVVGLRYDGAYPYKNICLEVVQTTPAGERCDTMDLALADDYGNLHGIGIAASFQLTDTMPRYVHASGTPVRVRHLMRTDTLRGITQVGLFFVPAARGFGL